MYELETDRNGTITQDIATTAAMTVTNRYDDPFGRARGTSTVPDDKSLLGDPTDSSNGLIAIGQRTYSPALGRFETVDPVMESDDPQQMNGYAYAADNPLTNADPTGLMIPADGGGAGGGTTAHTTAPASGGQKLSASDSDQAAKYESINGPADQEADYENDKAAQYADIDDPAAYPAVPPPPVAKKSHHRGLLSSAWHATAGAVVAPVDAVTSVGSGVLNSGVSMVTGGAVNLNLHPCLSSADASVCRFGRDVGNGVTFVGVQFVPGVDELADAEEVAEGADVLSEGGEAFEDAGDGAGEGAEDSAPSCGAQSFTPSTRVLLGDGTPLAVAKVKPGDTVLATDPASGETTAQQVSKVWVNHDSDLMDVTVRSGGRTSVVHSTQHHPFYDATRHGWVEADLLSPGDGLRTNNGPLVTVVATNVVTGTADMWDLTVANDHDFYVVSTAGALLVHNCRDPEAGLDATGKVHGDLPDPADLDQYDPGSLASLRDQLVQSVQTRIARTVELGSDYGHGERQGAEQALIHSIDKYLSS